jgi:hypothetical protein
LAPDGKVRISIDGHTIEADRNHAVFYKDTTNTEGTASKSSSRVKVAGTGNGLSSDNPDALKTDLAAPQAELPGGGGGSGGAGKIAGTFKDIEKPTTIFYILGAAGLIFAAVFFYLTKDVRDSIIIALCSVGLIAIGVTVNTYPWVWLLGFVALVVFGGVWLYRAYKSGTLKTTLATVVQGVENADAAAQTAVKDSIAKAADDAGIAPKVKAVVTSIKNTL